MQTGAEPNIVLFFDCPEEEMVKRVLSRNQVPFSVFFLCIYCSEAAHFLSILPGGSVISFFNIGAS